MYIAIANIKNVENNPGSVKIPLFLLKVIPKRVS